MTTNPPFKAIWNKDWTKVQADFARIFGVYDPAQTEQKQAKTILATAIRTGAVK